MARTANVYIVIGDSALAFDEGDEVLEAIIDSTGTPDWANASVCDHRGTGGAPAYAELVTALNCAEGNAVACGIEVVRVPKEAVL